MKYEKENDGNSQIINDWRSFEFDSVKQIKIREDEDWTVYTFPFEISIETECFNGFNNLETLDLFDIGLITIDSASFKNLNKLHLERESLRKFSPKFVNFNFTSIEI